MNLLTTIMLCLLTLPPIVCAADNSSSGKPSDDKGTQSNTPYRPCRYGTCFCAPGIPGIPGSPGPAGPAGVAGSPGPQGTTGPRGDQGYDGKQGSQGPPGPKGSQGTRGPAAPPGAKGDAGDKGPLGPPGTLRSNWKQCVFKNLNDGKDTGLIKDCVFAKNFSDTALHVYWTGTLRVHGCTSCCKRWYFTFNGAECEAPLPIDGIVYLGGAKSQDPHRVRHIEGHCNNIHKGKVRVGFWVGNCASYGNADASTGWNSVSRIFIEEVAKPQA